MRSAAPPAIYRSTPSSCRSAAGRPAPPSWALFVRALFFIRSATPCCAAGRARPSIRTCGLRRSRGRGCSARRTPSDHGPAIAIRHTDLDLVLQWSETVGQALEADPQSPVDLPHVDVEQESFGRRRDSPSSRNSEPRPVAPTGGGVTSSASGACKVSSALRRGSARNNAAPARTNSGVQPTGAATITHPGPACSWPVCQSNHSPAGNHTSR